MFKRRILCYINIYPTQLNIMPYTLNPKWNNTIALSHTMLKIYINLPLKHSISNLKWYTTNPRPYIINLKCYNIHFKPYTLNHKHLTENTKS
jgi:hypothetical protein